MSRHDYDRSGKVAREPFYGLLMAAMRTADTENGARLRSAFPEVWEELDARYRAPRGLLPGERDAVGYRRGTDGSLVKPDGEIIPGGAW